MTATPTRSHRARTTIVALLVAVAACTSTTGADTSGAGDTATSPEATDAAAPTSPGGGDTMPDTTAPNPAATTTTTQDTTKEALTPVTFMAGFQPQANLPFVGVYVAAAEGMFADRGLEVDIQHSGGGGEHLQLLTTGTVDVTTQDAAVLLERRVDPGLPLVSIGLLGQTGQQAFVALKESGFDSPADWAGHTVGFKGTPPPDLFAILEAVGLTADDIELVNVGFDPRVLTQGQVDVLPVFKSNEPDTIRGWGLELDLWDPADFGVPTLGLTWVATEQMVATQPEMLDAFVDAALEGVRWADEHRDEAVKIVLEHTGDRADANHQRYMLDTELATTTSAMTDEFGLGWQTTRQFRDLADLLLETGALPQDLDVSTAFTNQFTGTD